MFLDRREGSMIWGPPSLPARPSPPSPPPRTWCANCVCEYVRGCMSMEQARVQRAVDQAYKRKRMRTEQSGAPRAGTWLTQKTLAKQPSASEIPESKKTKFSSAADTGSRVASRAGRGNKRLRRHISLISRARLKKSFHGSPPMGEINGSCRLRRK